MVEINSDSVEWNLLQKILLEYPEIKLVAFISTRGFPITSNFTQSIDSALISPILAAIHSMAEMLIVQCFNGLLNHVLIDAKEYNIFIREMGSDQILCFISKNKKFLEFITCSEQSGKIYSKILSLIKEKDTNSLIIERKYLSELFDSKNLKFNTCDGMPTLKCLMEIELQSKKIKVEYEGNLIIFSQF